MRRLRWAWPATTVALLCLGAPAGAEVVQRGNLRVDFAGAIAPRGLSRSGGTPVSVSVGGSISTTDGANPPQLRRISIAVNRSGRLDPDALPRCAIDQIQPATTAGALAACRSSLIGRGDFAARVLLPQQAPFPSSGEVYAFNGTYKGHPAILAHVFGTDPAPTSYTLPFVVTAIRAGTFGTLLRASLPQATSQWGFVTSLSLNLDRRLFQRPGRGAYLSAGCPTPKRIPSASFPLARSTFSFAGGASLTTKITRSCKALG